MWHRDITQRYLAGEESDQEGTNRPVHGRDDLKTGFCQATHPFYVISKSLHKVCSAQYLDFLYGSSGLPDSKQKWIVRERPSTELASLHSIAQTSHRLIYIKQKDKWAPPCNGRNVDILNSAAITLQYCFFLFFSFWDSYFICMYLVSNSWCL